MKKRCKLSILVTSAIMTSCGSPNSRPDADTSPLHASSESLGQATDGSPSRTFNADEARVVVTTRMAPCPSLRAAGLTFYDLRDRTATDWAAALQNYIELYYGSDAIRDYVHTIAIGRRLTIGDTEVRGTFDEKCKLIVLSTQDFPTNEQGVRILARAFEHELSSLLFRAHRSDFPEEAWLGLNPPGFAYGPGGLQMLREKGVEATGSLDRRLGFWDKYATSSIENDFNRIIEVLVDTRWRERTLKDGSLTRLHQKMKLAEEFYRQVDERFAARLANH